MIGLVVGTYRITEKIGEGGMGAVYKGVDMMLEREVAIKVLRPELANQPNLVERFRSEAVTLAKLNHPNIATLYSFLPQNNSYFMVMEFVQGQTLERILLNNGAMNWRRAVTLFCQALEGIEYAHRRGIIHRDIKPANMMLTPEGLIKVMDFGIARVLGGARLTQTGHLIGTIEYMPPEQIRGEQADVRSDIYSLGILLYEMLTGRVPFKSQSDYDLMRLHVEAAPAPPRTLLPDIPVPVEQAIMRSLAKRPDARFQSAAQFREALLAIAGESRAVEKATEMFPPTRMANAPVVPETRVAGGSATGAHMVAQTGTHAPSKGLGWKLYGGIAAALIVVAVTLALALSGGEKKDEPQTAPVKQQVSPAQSQTAPAESPTSPQPNQATPVPATQTETPGTASAGSTPPQTATGGASGQTSGSTGSQSSGGGGSTRARKGGGSTSSTTQTATGGSSSQTSGGSSGNTGSQQATQSTTSNKPKTRDIIKEGIKEGAAKGVEKGLKGILKRN